MGASTKVVEQTQLNNPSLELIGARYSGNSLRAAIALEESGLSYAATRINSDDNRTDVFLSLNPAGEVPILIDRRESRVVVISQSNAIMLHVAENAPNALIPLGRGEKGRFYERLFYFVTDVIGPNTGAFVIKAVESDRAKEVLVERAVAKLEAAERFLSKGSFMIGDRFSLVDISAYSIAKVLERRIDWKSRPQLRRWFDEIAERPAVIRGVQLFERDTAYWAETSVRPFASNVYSHAI